MRHITETFPTVQVEGILMEYELDVVSSDAFQAELWWGRLDADRTVGKVVASQKFFMVSSLCREWRGVQ